MLKTPFMSRAIGSLAAIALVASCSHEPPKPTPEELAAQAQKAEADKQAAAKAEADKKAAAEAEALRQEKAKLDAAVAALPAAPAIPPSPAYLGPVDAPPDNALTPEKVALGQQLFFDKRLSKDGTESCESCHHPDQSFTSGSAVDAKVGGKMNVRNAPTMINLGYHGNGYYWDGRKPTLETVSQAAWSGQLGGDPEAVPVQLNANPTYRALFQRAFGGPATAQNIPQALASFLRALKGGDSPYDKFDEGDKKAVSKEAQAGFQVFTDKGCTLCHAPPLYSDTDFHAVGIGWDKDKKAFADHGRMDATKDPGDDGKFKTPSLRDVAKTGPYFHDGSVKTLDEAIDLMAAGGVPNPNLDAKLHPAKLTKKQKAELKAFLESLTGTIALAAPPTLP